MDKVQIYYIVLLVINFIVMVGCTAARRESPAVPSEQLPLLWAIRIAFGLPIMGRLFGWW